MANELNFPLSPGGQTIVAQVYDEGWTQQGANVAMTEFATALYRGNMPAAIPYGRYEVLFRLTSGTGTILGQGTILWDSAREIEFVPDVLELVVCAAGSTASAVRTGCTKATGFYNNMVFVVIQDGTGAASSMTATYSSVNGQFNLTDALPFIPAAGDRAWVLSPRDWAATRTQLLASIAGIQSDTDAIQLDTAAILVDTADMQPKVNDIWWKEGLDPANDTTYRPTKIFVGPEGTPLLEIILTGDCATEIVANRT